MLLSKMTAPKVVNLIGNISNDLNYKLCPSTEFSTGHWQIAISTLCVEASQDINSFVNITSSACVNQRFDKGEVKVYEQPLITVHLNLRNKSKSINRFSYPIYLDINRQSEDIEFKFYDSLTGQKCNFDAKVSLNVMFRRFA